MGITHDEMHSFKVWEIKKKIYLNLFFNSNYNIVFPDYGMKYYGIGFHIFSLPFEYIFNEILKNYDYSTIGLSLMIKHPTVVIIFCISGIFFKKILDLILKNNTFSSCCAVMFLLYPYLFGHSHFNFKDIPFMSVWIICTYFIMKIVNNYHKDNKIFNSDLIYLSILTAFLLSIRVSGILIFLQYLIFIIFIQQISKKKLFDFFKPFFTKIILFCFIFFISLYLLHPSFWNNPIEIIDAIKYMSNHIQTVCTITFGECMKAQDLPSSYIPLWLLVKLPIFILLGLVILPFTEKKLFSNQENSILIGSLIISILSIILLLIFFKVNLYDELRQVLFIVPIFFIISLSVIYFYKKKLAYIIVLSYIVLFIFQNFKIFPYNYLWLNSISNYTQVTNNFERDYWGVSTFNLANYFKNNLPKKNECIISNRGHGIKSLLNNDDTCFLSFQNLHKKNTRPFYVVLIERALNKGVPNNCKIIHNENFKMNFSKENIIVAKVFKCV